MTQGENTTTVRYALRTPRANCTLELRPLTTFRDYHATTHENPALDAHYEIAANTVKLAPYPDLPPLYLIHSGGAVDPAVLARLQACAGRNHGICPVWTETHRPFRIGPR
jgi:hypothetical protein